MNRKSILIIFAILTSVLSLANGNLNNSTRKLLDGVHMQISSRKLDAILNEALNFEAFGKYCAYSNLAMVVSNDWRDVLVNIDNIATNNVERLLLLGVGKQFSERFYIDFISELCVLQTNNVITARELDWAMASTRYDIDSCLFRRYQEPKVVALVNTLKRIYPLQSCWDDILSGKRYTNYLHEVEAGLWGPVRQDLP